MHPFLSLSLEKEWMQNPISHPLCFCRSRFLCDPGSPGWLGSLRGLGLGSPEWAKHLFLQQEFNVFGVDWETGFVQLFGTGLHVRAICLELADTAGFTCSFEVLLLCCRFLLFSHSLSKTLDWLNNTGQSAFFGTSCFRFRVDLGCLGSPDWSGCGSIPGSWPAAVSSCPMAGAGCSCCGTGLTLLLAWRT